MKFKFIVNKNANFYFFLHNLAECEWPIRCRKLYNSIWEKKLSAFSQKEKDAIKEFQKIYEKYAGKKYLGESFFIKENPWKGLEAEIPRQEIDNLKTIFSIWQNKFEKIYKKDLPNLKKWQKELESQMKGIKQRRLLDTINETLSILFNTPVPNKIINVNLMLCPLPEIAGGHRIEEIGGENILVELSHYSIREKKGHIVPVGYIFGIIFHEIIHRYYMPPYFRPLLEKTFKNRKLSSDMEEIIDRALLPSGILGIRLFNVVIPYMLAGSSGFLSQISYAQTVKILAFTDRYVREKRKFDKNYIKMIFQMLKQRKK